MWYILQTDKWFTIALKDSFWLQFCKKCQINSSPCYNSLWHRQKFYLSTGQKRQFLLLSLPKKVGLKRYILIFSNDCGLPTFLALFLPIIKSFHKFVRANSFCKVNPSNVQLDLLFGSSMCHFLQYCQALI